MKILLDSSVLIDVIKKDLVKRPYLNYKPYSLLEAFFIKSIA
jgi:hypothetical protein